jgi:hypothetical protein
VSEDVAVKQAPESGLSLSGGALRFVARHGDEPALLRAKTYSWPTGICAGCRSRSARHGSPACCQSRPTALP